MKKKANPKAWRRSLCALMSCALLFALAACGGGKGNSSTGQNATGNEGGSSGHSQQNAENSSVGNNLGATGNLSMEDSELYFVSAGGGLIAVAFRGPEDIKAYFTDNTTNEIYSEAIMGHTYLGNGWTIYMTRSQEPEKVDDPINADGMGMIVYDQSSYNQASDDYSSYKTFSNLGRQLTNEELKDIGLLFFGEHFGTVGGGTSYSGNSFTLEARIGWLDTAYARAYWDFDVDESELDGLMERMTFFAEDGTPLSDYFSDYTTELKLNSYNNVWLYFYTNLTKAENKEKLNELKACNPYMVYTYDDGSTQQFPLLKD